MILTKIYSKNIVNNKIVFIVKNVVFLTIFFSMILCNFQGNISLMILILPSIKFIEDSDEGEEENKVEENNEGLDAGDDESEEEAEDDNNVVSQGVKAAIASGGVRNFGLGCAIVGFLIFLIAALTQIIDPISQLTYVVMKDAQGNVIKPNDPNNNNGSPGGESGSTPGGDTTKPLSGVLDWIMGVAGDFFERVTNFFVYGQYATMEGIVQNKVQDFADKFYDKYYVKIDIGLLMATLYYDGSLEDEVDTDNDGKPDKNEKLSARIEYIENENNFEKLASIAFTITETQYICKREDTTEGPQYITQFVSSKQVDVPGNSVVCQENTITQDLNDPTDYVYDYKLEYNRWNYFNKLLKSEVLTALFPEAVGEKQKEQLASEIERSYNIWYIFYGEENEGTTCVAPGNIPPKIMAYMRSPLNGTYKISSAYGPRNDPFTGARLVHNGVDVVPDVDTGIYATAKGKVVEVSYSEEEGNYIVLSHEIMGDIYYSAYKHLASGSIVVQVGQEVQIGDRIATMGATGKVTGAHLHFTFYVQYEDGKRNYYNPENLFSAAKNYEYECSNDVVVGTCSTDGAVAVYANKRRYSFNLLRSIIKTELDYYKQDTRLVVDLDMDGLKALLNGSNSSTAKEAKKKINFDTKQVLYGDYWLPFSDYTRDQATMHEVIDLMAKVSDKTYEYVYMGISLIKGSNFKEFEYKSAKEMYDSFSGNKFEQVKWTVEKLVANNPYLYNILQTFDIGPEYIVKSGDTPASIASKFLISEGELRNSTNINTISLTSGQKLKINDRQIIINLLLKLMIRDVDSRDNYKNKVYYNYLQYVDDPDSTIEKYLNECLMIEKPGWADCYTFEDKGKCKSNLRAYSAKATELVNEAPTAIGKRILLNGLSLWGKVRYCGWCSKSNIHCTDIYPPEAGPELAGKPGASRYKYSFLTRCSDSFPISLWYYEGFNPKWPIVHNYNYADTQKDPNATMGNFTAGIAGLDCEGFVTWVMNHAFGTFRPKSQPMTADDEVPLFGTGTTGGTFKSVMGGACDADTEYTTAHNFGVGNFKSKEIAGMLTPGDVVCDDDNRPRPDEGIPAGRHVMIYMGYDDLDGDGIANNSDRLYFVHSSGGEMGVNVTSKKASDAYFDHYRAYFTYK